MKRIAVVVAAAVAGVITARNLRGRRETADLWRQATDPGPAAPPSGT